MITIHMVQRIQIMKMKSIFQRAHNHHEAIERIPIASHPLLHAVRIILHPLPLEMEEMENRADFWHHDSGTDHLTTPLPVVFYF